MGKSYSKLEKVKKAFECFEKANKIKPNNADAVFGMGLLHLNKNQFQESIVKFKLAN